MFNQNQKVVYPGHGVAKINRIITKKIAGRTVSFFELKFIHKDMVILVPVDNAGCVGIRALSSQEDVGVVLSSLSQPMILSNNDIITSNWNKRNKEYLGKIRSGNLYEICAIYRELRHIEFHKELSFGEKALLQQTESLLVEEIALVNDSKEEAVTQQIRALILPATSATEIAH